MMGVSQNVAVAVEKTLDFAAGARIFSARVLLQSARTTAETMETIREVVQEYIGAEEAVIFEVDPQKTALWLHWSCGIDQTNYPFAEAIPRSLLERVLAGESFFGADQAEEENTQDVEFPPAVIPIFATGEIVGVLAIFRLRPEKSCLETSDRKICEAIANCCSRILSMQGM